MKAIINLGLVALLFGVLLSSCKKDILRYEDDPRLFFQIPGSGSVTLRDSIMYSFPAHPNVGDLDTLWFNAYTMGKASPDDREIGIKINTDSSTAVEGVNFKFGGKVIPANAYSVRIPIVIYKAGLKDKSVRLQIEVAENQNFKVGFGQYKKAVFIWGDKFLKPDIWDKSTYLSAFGRFTETRYAFILKTCNITELPDPMNLVMVAYYNAMVREALSKYNSTPGNNPLRDEFGTVGFPIYLGVGSSG